MTTQPLTVGELGRMFDLTGCSPRQREVFAYIFNYFMENGFPPTLREIATKFEINSPNGVLSHLKAMMRKKLITRAAGESRGIKIVGLKLTASGPLSGTPSYTTTPAPLAVRLLPKPPPPPAALEETPPPPEPKFERVQDEPEPDFDIKWIGPG